MQQCGWENDRRVLYVTYKGDPRRVCGRMTLTRTLDDVFNYVAPGDIVQLLPGKYWPPILYDDQTGSPPACRPIVLTEICGKPERPITVRGMGWRTELTGGLGGVPHNSMLPDSTHFAFFKLFDCNWLEFEHFAVDSCWPSFIYMENSTYVTVRCVTAEDGRYLVYARGENTHHVLLEGNHWRQDPTGSMWADLAWIDSKKRRYYYYNGGLFGSYGIPGSVVIRNNLICDAFNGVRMKVKSDQTPSANHNVEIRGNTFLRIRDNPVEPERGATNWWITGNTIVDAHAWFSLDGVGGSNWYYLGNTGWQATKPGECAWDANQGGKIYKFDPTGPFPDGNVFAAHNSWQIDFCMIKEGTTRYFTHVNNAVLFGRPEGWSPPDGGECCGPLPGCFCPGPGRKPCAEPCAEDNTAGGKEELSVLCQGNPCRESLVCEEFTWDKTLVFHNDLTNRPFAQVLLANGQEQPPLYFADACFSNPVLGDLHVANPLPVPSAEEMVFRKGKEWAGDYDWMSPQGSIVGAMQPGGTRFQGPPFVFMVPAEPFGGYVERPRLTGLDPVRANTEVNATAAAACPKPGLLTLYFSAPLCDKAPLAPVVLWRDGIPAKVEATVDGSRLFVPVPAVWRDFPEQKGDEVVLPWRLYGANTQRATLWANEHPQVRFAPGEIPDFEDECVYDDAGCKL